MGAPVFRFHCQMCFVHVRVPSAQMPELSSGSAMCGQRGGNATNSPFTLVTRTRTPCISTPVRESLTTSSAEQSLCQPTAQLLIEVGRSDRVVRAFIQPPGVQEHVAFRELRAILPKAESIVI